MNGEVVNGVKGVDTDDGEIEVADSSEDTIVLSEDAADIDTGSDFSAELNVEKLVAKLESGDGDAAAKEKEVHRRIEEVNEQRRAEAELDNTFNFNLDADV